MSRDSVVVLRQLDMLLAHDYEAAIVVRFHQAIQAAIAALTREAAPQASGGDGLLAEIQWRYDEMIAADYDPSERVCAIKDTLSSLLAYAARQSCARLNHLVRATTDSAHGLAAIATDLASRQEPGWPLPNLDDCLDPPADSAHPQAAGSVASPAGYTLEMIEDAFGAVVPMPRKYFDAFRVRLAEMYLAAGAGSASGANLVTVPASELRAMREEIERLRASDAEQAASLDHTNWLIEAGRTRIAELEAAYVAYRSERNEAQSKLSALLDGIEGLVVEMFDRARECYQAIDADALAAFADALKALREKANG